MARMMGSAGVAAAAGAVLWASAPWETAARTFIAVAAGVVAVAAVAVGVVACSRAANPRIYRQGDELNFRLGTQGVIGVPLEVVEAFFLGQGPAHLPRVLDKKLESVNLVARLSERATKWQHQSVDARLGAWCDGYVTVRGTFCEPLDTDLVHRLNRQLANAKEEIASRR